MPRLPKFDPSRLDPVQKAIHDGIVSGPRGKFGGPFIALIEAPNIADQIQSLGAALRFNTTIDAQLREIAILVAARHWRSEVEWNAHVVIALREGIDSNCVAALSANDIQGIDQVSYKLVASFCQALLENGEVPDVLYGQAEAHLGIPQVVELVSLIGYFSLLAMLLNTFEISADPVDGVPPDHLGFDRLSPP